VTNFSRYSDGIAIESIIINTTHKHKANKLTKGIPQSQVQQTGTYNKRTNAIGRKSP
jgi:hypothetical protein